MSGYFPWEIIVEILHRQTHKSLVKCTSVYKVWRSIITDSAFISDHFQRTINSLENRDNTLILLRQSPSFSEVQYLRFDDGLLSEFSPMEFPFVGRSEYCFSRIVSTCNGLVCLVDELETCACTFILWNPSIRKWWALQIYLSFDLGDGVFGEIMLPQSLTPLRNGDVSILTGGELLGVAHKTRQLVFSVWEMEEYGVVESWTKVLTFSSAHLLRGIPRVLAFRRSREVVLEGGEGVLLSVDLRTRVIRDLRVTGKGHSSVDDYVESLFLLNKTVDVMSY
ncbi:F-box protein [Quillaja saponaria]|uniref:F-box protein n=1 Tax=Quillaja saponaria TaxID=32244 RepID=A0AAD7Q787_QUISA|nr:F-box protein [Quillaja saponaria]